MFARLSPFALACVLTHLERFLMKSKIYASKVWIGKGSFTAFSFLPDNRALAKFASFPTVVGIRRSVFKCAAL